MSSRGKRSSDRHGWNSLDKYIRIHDAYLDNLRGDFVLDDELSYEFESEDTFVIKGRIICAHGLFLDVLKVLEVEDRHGRDRCRTIKYSYHAGVSGSVERSIFRYDNADSKPGHEDAHHKHLFDHVTWREKLPEEWIGYDHWPHLNEVIEELREWWEMTGQMLGLEVSDANEPT